MELQEQIEIIASYDGWEYQRDRNNVPLYAHPDKAGVYIMDALQIMYSSSLNALHPVAMKVLDELKLYAQDSEPAFRMHIIIKENCSHPPINGQYIDLLNAVADGIEFLNSKK